MELQQLAKFIIFIGVILVLIGVLISLLGRVPGIGRLPGDILIKRDGFTFYFPLATSILISILLTIILNLLLRK